MPVLFCRDQGAPHRQRAPESGVLCAAPSASARLMTGTESAILRSVVVIVFTQRADRGWWASFRDGLVLTSRPGWLAGCSIRDHRVHPDGAGRGGRGDTRAGAVPGLPHRTT